MIVIFLTGFFSSVFLLEEKGGDDNNAYSGTSISDVSELYLASQDTYFEEKKKEINRVESEQNAIELIEELTSIKSAVDIFSKWNFYYRENNLIHEFVSKDFVNPRLLEELFKAGLDINKKDFRGETPLLVLLKNSRNPNIGEILEMFEKYGAEVDNGEFHYEGKAVFQDVLSYVLQNKDFSAKKEMLSFFEKRGYTIGVKDRYFADVFLPGNENFAVDYIEKLGADSLFLMLKQKSNNNLFYYVLENFQISEDENLDKLVLAASFHKNLSINIYEEFIKSGADINFKAVMEQLH